VKAWVVDERDVSGEYPLPLFRVTVWRRGGAHSTTYDIEAAGVSEVLEFTRSSECDGADQIEVFCKIRTDRGSLATVLLETIER
jgi:hypothetical protein